jgi:hypothetical protein
MDALPLFFEVLLAWSAISFAVFACLADDSDTGPRGGRRYARPSVSRMYFPIAKPSAATL